MGFLETLAALSALGLKGSRQQSIIWVLWMRGPSTWNKIRLCMPKGMEQTNFQIQKLKEKGLIRSSSLISDRRMITVYSLTDEAKQHLDQHLKK